MHFETQRFKKDLKMRTKILATIAALGSLFMTSAIIAPDCSAADKDIRQVIRKYDRVECAECINLGGLILSLAKTAVREDIDAELLKTLKRITVFSMEECAPEDRARFASEAETAFGGYEKLMEVRDDEDDLTIYVKMSAQEVIKEFVVYSGSDASVIILSGKMPMSALEQLIESTT